MALQIRRGSETDRANTTFAPGELVWTTSGSAGTFNKLWVGDGTQGGVNILRYSAGTGLMYDQTTNTLKLNNSSLGFTTNDVAEGTANKYFTSTAMLNALSTAFGNGTQSGISFNFGTPGAISATVTGGGGAGSLISDTNPRLGNDLYLNSHDIRGNGNINTTGSILVSGSIQGATVTATTFTGTLSGEAHGNVVAADLTVLANTTTKALAGATLNISGTATANLFSGTHTGNVVGNSSVVLVNTSTNVLGGSSLTVSDAVTASTVNTGNIVLSSNLTSGGIKIDTNASNLDSGFELLSINTYITNPTLPSAIIMNRARGTKSVPLIIQTGDQIGALAFTGQVGANTTKPAAFVAAAAFGTVVAGSNGRVPGQLQLITTNSTGALDTTLTIDATNGIKSSGPVAPVVYANNTTRDSAIPSPVAGMIIAVTSGGSGFEFQGYTGSAWVKLN